MVWDKQQGSGNGTYGSPDCPTDFIQKWIHSLIQQLFPQGTMLGTIRDTKVKET